MRMFCSLLIVLMPAFASAQEQTPEQSLVDYRAELARCRKEHGGGHDLPDVKFFLFGMGARTKLIYKAGVLLDAASGRELRRWNVRKEIIVPCDYAVWIDTADGEKILLREDEQAVWLDEGGHGTALKGTDGPVKLPTFADQRFPRVLRVLHQEILVNVEASQPMPNRAVYGKPWYRDGAMVGMVLKRTGNLGLIGDWIRGLREPFDKNNGGVTEPDNLGQALFLVSLVSDKTHPLVATVLAEAKKFEMAENAGRYIKGRSDFAEHPVYQTKWMKFGLKALDLPDPYVVPKVPDGYSALFWMDYTDQYVAGHDSNDRGDYPYLGWACDHFHGQRKSPLANNDYPLSWEARASQAHYDGMKLIDPVFAERKIATPHTWHAAEMFLLLMDEIQKGGPP